MYQFGEGVEENYPEAVELYTRAANGGFLIAMRKLGSIFESGHIVGQDFNRAVELYERAADGGDLKAVIRLARMCFFGYGVEQNISMAAELNKRAADGGQLMAMRNLGVGLIWAWRRANLSQGRGAVSAGSGRARPNRDDGACVYVRNRLSCRAGLCYSDESLRASSGKWRF